MQPAISGAFKEWAVICAALAEGRQSLIVRKGGIHESPGGFQPEHREFWLFPTFEHQAADRLTVEARGLLERVEADRPPPGTLRISTYLVVEDLAKLREAQLLPGLAGLHIWSDRTLQERFSYRRPGLFVLTVRAYRIEQPHEVRWSESFAGCRSWVELPQALVTDGAKAVLSDDEFARQWAAVRVATSATRLA